MSTFTRPHTMVRWEVYRQNTSMKYLRSLLPTPLHCPPSLSPPSRRDHITILQGKSPLVLELGGQGGPVIAELCPSCVLNSKWEMWRCEVVLALHAHTLLLPLGRGLVSRTSPRNQAGIEQTLRGSVSVSVSVLAWPLSVSVSLIRHCRN